MKRYIPNVITSLNLICGVLAVLLASQGYIIIAAWFIVLAAVMDFLDGMAARALKAYSEVGEQLDSLADLISFGLAPAVLLFQLITHAIEGSGLSEYPEIAYVVILLPLFSALRLARFNTDDTQKSSFLGLAVPASALFFAGIALAAAYAIEIPGLAGWVGKQASNAPLLIVLILAFSFFMVMPMRLFSLKMSDGSWENNKVQWLFGAFVVVLMLILKAAALPLIILGYIFSGALVNLFNNDTKQR